MKILAFGDCILHNTGYGRVSRQVLGYFVSKGHQVIQLAWSYTLPPQKYPIFKNGKEIVGTIDLVPAHTTDQFATASTIHYINGLKPDFVYNSNDYFTIRPLLEKKNEWTHTPKLINYGIIDGPECAKVYSWIINQIDYPVSPSKYGFKQLKEVTNKGFYIPHGVDTKTYRPLPNKEEIKKKLGLGDKFVFGTLNRNIWRKMYPLLFRAYADIKKQVPNSCLYVLADPTDIAGHGLPFWLKHFDLTASQDPQKPADVMFHPAYLNVLMNLNDQELAEVYNSFDVYVSTSMSEGFGLGTIESQACGVPSIMPNNTANTELVRGHGWLYDIVRNKDGSPVLIPPTIPLNWITYSYELPDIAALKECMIEAYNSPDKVADYGRMSYDFAQLYDWDSVLTGWDNIL